MEKLPAKMTRITHKLSLLATTAVVAVTAMTGVASAATNHKIHFSIKNDVNATLSLPTGVTAKYTGSGAARELHISGKGLNANVEYIKYGTWFMSGVNGHSGHITSLATFESDVSVVKSYSTPRSAAYPGMSKVSAFVGSLATANGVYVESSNGSTFYAVMKVNGGLIAVDDYYGSGAVPTGLDVDQYMEVASSIKGIA